MHAIKEASLNGTAEGMFVDPTREYPDYPGLALAERAEGMLKAESMLKDGIYHGPHHETVAPAPTPPRALSPSATGLILEQWRRSASR